MWTLAWHGWKSGCQMWRCKFKMFDYPAGHVQPESLRSTIPPSLNSYLQWTGLRESIQTLLNLSIYIQADIIVCQRLHQKCAKAASDSFWRFESIGILMIMSRNPCPVMTTRWSWSCHHHIRPIIKRALTCRAESMSNIYMWHRFIYPFFNRINVQLVVVEGFYDIGPYQFPVILSCCILGIPLLKILCGVVRSWCG